MSSFRLITLSGLDGSGKSTQIDLLKEFLEKQGKTFFYFHAVEFSVGNLGVRHLKNRRCPTPTTSTRRESVTKANWLQIQLRKIALGIDICRFKRLTKKLKVDYIISDRYFYDSVVNICYLSVIARSEATKQSRDCFATLAMTTLEKFIPKPDFAFYISVKPEKIMQRDRKPDQGIDYLKAKDKIFSEKIKDWNMIVVDGEREKEKMFEEIKKALSLS